MDDSDSNANLLSHLDRTLSDWVGDFKHEQCYDGSGIHDRLICENGETVQSQAG